MSEIYYSDLDACISKDSYSIFIDAVQAHLVLCKTRVKIQIEAYHLFYMYCLEHEVRIFLILYSNVYSYFYSTTFLD
jgi:hypothetical protein